MRTLTRIRQATLITRRLLLDPIKADHASLLFQGLRDERIYRFIPQKPPVSVKALRRRFVTWSRRVSPDGRSIWLNWALQRRIGKNEYVGFCQATIPPGKSALIAYVIFPQFWGLGLATEAVNAMIRFLFNNFEIHDIKAHVEERNIPSRKVLEKLLFVQTRNSKTKRSSIKRSSTTELEFVKSKPSLSRGVGTRPS